MAYHSITSLLVHFVFSTKNREPLITEEMQPRLWAYIGGIARLNQMKALLPQHAKTARAGGPSRGWRRE